MNAPVMVELEGETDPLKIAMKELKLVNSHSVYQQQYIMSCMLQAFIHIHVFIILTLSCVPVPQCILITVTSTDMDIVSLWS